MITLLAIIFVVLLLIGIAALVCEAMAYIIPAMLVVWVLKRLDKIFDSKKDSSQK